MSALQSTLVVKVGTSSLTSANGELRSSMFAKIASEIADLVSQGHRLVLVTSGAISAGLVPLEIDRPVDLPTLQAIAAVGQPLLMNAWDRAMANFGLVTGQVLLAPLDFGDRRQYLHARSTVSRLLDMGVVPIINENDAVADDEIRFGDNDKLAALVCQLLGAQLLILLTDAPGLLMSDPRILPHAPLIEEVAEADHEMVAGLAGGTGTERGSGGMASKVAAARMAAWSGVRTVIGSAERSGMLKDALEGTIGAGTVFLPRSRRLSARKLWIAFALPPMGCLEVDFGAKDAVTTNGRSLLRAGVTCVRGEFVADDAVEIQDPDGLVFAKGLARQSSEKLRAWAGERVKDLPRETDPEAVHRDDLVVLL